MNRLIFKDARFRRSIRSSDCRKLPLMFFLQNRIFYRRFLFLSSDGNNPDQFLLKRLTSRRRSIFYKVSKTRSFFFSRARNHCLLTGRSHSVYSDFKLSRMSLREDILEGKTFSVGKSSW